MDLLRKTLLALVFTVFSTLALAGQVNINTADAPTLAANITGVGIKKAEDIVAYRKANGPFKTIDDLTKVKGIGPKILEKNQDNLIVAEAKKAR